MANTARKRTAPRQPRTDDGVVELDKIEFDPTPPFRFMWAGQEYTCRHPDETDIRRVRDEMAEMVGDDETAATAVLLYLIGEEQYDQMDASDGPVFTKRHLDRLAELWAAHHKLDVPKSSGSRTRSRHIK